LYCEEGDYIVAAVYLHLNYGYHLWSKSCPR
jgi:hypothetical protein